MRNNCIKYKAKIEQPYSSRFKFVFFASIFIFIISLVAQLYVTNQLAVQGKEMVMLQERKAELAKEISEMELEQSKYASLKYIEIEADKLGFVGNKDYVSTISPVTSAAALPKF